MVCADLSWLYSLSLLSLGITLIVIGVAYALGQLLGNPQFNVWAKTEIFQVFLSFFIVLLVIFLCDSLCHFRYSDLASLSPDGAPEYPAPAPYPEIGRDDNVINASGKFLANIAHFINTETKAARALYGVSEEASRYSRMPCMPAATFCLYGTSGYSVRPFSGFSSWIQVLGLSLYTDTASYLTVLIQMALLAFVSGGGVMMYLPFAIIIRSLPFMRQLGGGLLAICIALFLIYPALLTAESLFWNPYGMLGSSEWGTLVHAAGGMGKGFLHATWEDYTEWMALAWAEAGSIAAAQYAVAAATMVPVPPASAISMLIGVGIANTIQATFLGMAADDSLHDTMWSQGEIETALQASLHASAISFLSATFLLAFNMIAIGASAREIGRLLGQEVDLSRLMQVL